jgi:hypothetical protein
MVIGDPIKFKTAEAILEIFSLVSKVLAVSFFRLNKYRYSERKLQRFFKNSNFLETREHARGPTSKLPAAQSPIILQNLSPDAGAPTVTHADELQRQTLAPPTRTELSIY